MTQYPVSYPAPTQGDLVREFALPIYQSRGWLKLIGILSIIGGVAQALTIVGILFAWLPIWMGVLLMQAASGAQNAQLTGQKYELIRSLGSLKTFFVLNGVLVLLGILFGLLALCITIVLPLLGLTLIPPEYLNPYYYYP